MTDRVTARQMKAALWWHFTPRYAVLTELTCTDDEARAELAAWREDRTLPWNERQDTYPSGKADRRCDVLLWRADDRIAVEIKVTKADLLADVADPRKQYAWRQITHRHAYAVPDYLLVDAAQAVPPTSGIIVVNPGAPSENHGYWRHDGVQWSRRIRRAKDWDPGPLPQRVQTTVMHRFAQAEAAMKGYGGAHRDDDAEALRAKVGRLTADLTLAESARFRAEERASQWRRRFAAHEPLPCAWCGNPVVPDHDRHSVSQWRHRDPADDTGCAPLRATDHAWAESIFPAPDNVVS